MQIEEFIIEIKNSLRAYDKKDLVDEVSIYGWTEAALRRFGGDIAIKADALVDVVRGEGKLPGSFFSLISAYRTEFAGYEEPDCDEGVKAELQNTFAWKERTERSYRWCSCEECCKTEDETTIVEKFYINIRNKDHEIRCHYRKPELLRLEKPMLKDKCLGRERKMMNQENGDAINIVGKTMYANFDGPVYIEYKSLPFNPETGDIEIPETPLGELQAYVETYVKMRFFEEAMYNGEAPNVGEIYKLLMQQEAVKFRQAKTEVKMMQLRFDELYSLKRKNKIDFHKFERMTPNTGGVVKLI